ncbi:hypothetical protein [Arthrobacter sp. HLT1-20]
MASGLCLDVGTGSALAGSLLAQGTILATAASQEWTVEGEV